MCCIRSAVSHWFSVCSAASCSSSCSSFRPCLARSPSSCSCSLSTSFSRTSSNRSNFSCLVIGCSHQRKTGSWPRPSDSRTGGMGEAWSEAQRPAGEGVRSFFGVDSSEGGSGRESRRPPREARRETATEVPGESSRGLRSPSRGSWSVRARDTRRDQGIERETRREGTNEAAAERRGVSCRGLSAFRDLSMGLSDLPLSRSQRASSCGRGKPPRETRREDGETSSGLGGPSEQGVKAETMLQLPATTPPAASAAPAGAPPEVLSLWISSRAARSVCRSSESSGTGAPLSTLTTDRARAPNRSVESVSEACNEEPAQLTTSTV
mmetsp:Transcript_24350/g.69797  ORF Transcript_24350/g.69797 Transcript_24350/m.69797 type:complete len:323 (-) Transcript_24350:948-1916(-)